MNNFVRQVTKLKNDKINPGIKNLTVSLDLRSHAIF